MDAGRGPDRLTIVEQPPRPPTTFYSTPMDGINPQQQQHRAGYGDLCRAQGPTDTLSAAYHSRYLASLPALTSTSGCSFPFLGNMFASGPTSPFRAPSAPGIGNCGVNGTSNPMRQQLFWPPTPPPDGYGRYGLNTSLFPLFGSVSPSSADNGAAAAAYMLSQGLASRHLTPCTSTTVSSSHHLLDPHKDQGFFSSGFGLASPLTPSSQLSATNPFSHHLIPPPHPLDFNKYPSTFCPATGGSTNTKDFVSDDSKSHHHHHHHHNHHQSTNCQPAVKTENSCSPLTTTTSTVKHSHPSVTTTSSAKSTKIEKKSSTLHSPARSKQIEDTKLKKSQEETTTKQCQQSRQIQQYFVPSKDCPPFEIDVTCEPPIKPDILSPPFESPSSVISSYHERKKHPIENTCLSCASNVFEKTNIPKIEEINNEEEDNIVIDVDNDDNKKFLKFKSVEDAVPTDSSITVMEKSDDAISGDQSDYSRNNFTSICSPLSSNFVCEKTVINTSVTNTRTDINGVNIINAKHITAAVIPTAPKQQHISSFNYNRVDSLNPVTSLQSSGLESEDKNICPISSESPKLSALSKIKTENSECVETPLSAMHPQIVSSNYCKNLNDNKIFCTKVKDMIKTTKQSNFETQIALIDGQQTVPSNISDKMPDTMDKPFQISTPSIAKLCPVIPEKASVQGKVQAFDVKKKVVGPLKTESPVYKFESLNVDSPEKQPVANWSKATVTPFNWHQKEEDPQAINLTICKKKESFSPIPSFESSSSYMDSMNAVDTSTNSTTNSCKTPVTEENNVPTSNAMVASCCVAGTGVIGVCHPNISKGKVFVGSKFSAVTSVTSQMDVSNDGEVHVASLTKSSTFQTLNTAATACLNRAASVTGFQNTKTQLKTERLTPNVRTKTKDNEKIISTTGKGTTLATLAPKLAKKVGFLKDTKSSHTLSTSSSMSSTSIVFPATVNPCIPIGIAIAQQRQDTSTTATIGKNQSAVPPSNSGVLSSASHLSSTRTTTEIQQPQEILRDQKPQEIGCPNSSVSTDSTNFLVTQGPTIVSRQWESEAVTRATLPSPWVTHGSIVAPALWIGQGATATAAYATAAPASTPQLPTPLPAPVNSLETPPISLPPGGYQLARDSVTGHLFLIPAANIVDRTAMWPSYNATTGSTLPIQQLVTQQHHTQFEQVLPQVSEQEHVQDCLAFSVQQTHIGETTKDVRVVDSCCDTTGNYKTAEIQTIKTEEKDGSSHVPSVPLASGQTFTFTTFPTPCDPSGFSYVLQSSTVMHLAHTAQATSIQTESGKRSQGTSPLHPASPSPSPCCPSLSTVLMSENDEGEEDEHEDSDGAASMDSTQIKLSQPTQSVTTAVQVDMDSRTNSEVEEDEEEDKNKASTIEDEQIKMSDSANQTEGGLSDSGKDDSESEMPVEESKEINKAAVIPEPGLQTSDCEIPCISDINEDKMKQIPESPSPPCKIIITEVEEEEEIAPSLPVESKPVRDFIDHHGLDLLVDSIEEFASRERNETKEEIQHESQELKEPESIKNESSLVITEKKTLTPLGPSYTSLDTSSCTDGLGLLCALAEQRFFEEALNVDDKDDIKPTPEKSSYDCYSFLDEEEDSHNVNARYSSPRKDNIAHQRSSSSPPSFQQILNGSVEDVPSSNLQACEKEMRKRLADLQRKFKKKQLQLAQLMPPGDSDEDAESPMDDEIPVHYEKKKIFTLPRFKHKSTVPGKSYNRFPSHSYKIIAQRFSTSRMHLTSTLKRTNLKKLNRSQNGTLELKKQSPSHPKNLSNTNSELEIKLKKVKKLGNLDKHLEGKKFKIVKKIDEKTKDDRHKSLKSASNKNLTIQMSDKKNKLCLSQKTSNVDKSSSYSKSGTICHSDFKPTLTLKTSEKSSKIVQEKLKCENSLPTSLKEKNVDNISKRKILKGSETKHLKKIKIEKMSPDRDSLEDQALRANKKTKLDVHKLSNSENSKANDKSKVPFFDEQAWFVRRSERIFLSDARPPATPQNSSNSATKKVSTSQTNMPHKVESKDKKEHIIKSITKVPESKVTSIVKSEKDSKEFTLKPVKTKFISKQKTKLSESTLSLSKKRCISTCSNSSKSSDASSSAESDEEPNDKLLSSTTNKTSVSKIDKSKNIIKRNASNHQITHTPSNDFLKSCILNISTLVDKTRVLILDEGLFYAGHIIHVQAPDVYGIVLDGERAHRPHIFSREEILIATVLEVKPTETSQIPEGSRVCAYWSQQYRCLYPGTVVKASSPLPDPNLLYVEFDDGDSGRIPLNDIRILPPDFPIVSIEPNPLLLLGKRRPHISKDFNPEQKMDKSLQKESPKLKKKRTDSAEGKDSHDRSKTENQSPSCKKISSGNHSQIHTSKNDISIANTDKTKSKKLKISKEEGVKKKKLRESSSDNQFKGKKRKKHHDEHKHHHKHKHHHHKHHHKKHKLSHSSESPDESSLDASHKSPLCSPKHEGELVVEKTSDLTVTIKTSPSPHTMHTHREQHTESTSFDGASSKIEIVSSSAESSDDEEEESKSSKVKPKTKTNKKKKDTSENKPAKRKERVPSVEKSKIAAFLPVRQLWRWSGKGFRRPGAKGKGKKEFYRAIQRGKELLRVGDCAVFLSTGRPHLPYIGRIETMWESWGGKMDVKVKWFYHPEETKSSKKLTQLKCALFQSPHFDENDVQTISHKCEVISWEEYQRTKDKDKLENSLFDNNDTYYLAGTYDPYTGSLTMEPGIPKFPGITATEK